MASMVAPPADAVTFRILPEGPTAGGPPRFGPDAFRAMVGTYMQVEVPVRTGHCEFGSVRQQVRIVEVAVTADGRAATVTAEPVY